MRYRFGPALVHALRVRGLDLCRLASMAEVSPSTASSAVRGHALNLRTAMRIAKVVAASPVMPELEQWCQDEPPPV